MFIDGFLANVLAFPTPGTIIEASGAGYHRQPISFSVPRNAVTRNSQPFSFGFGVGTIAGRAIFSSLTGPEMLLALPFALPYSFGSQPDTNDAGTLCLQLTDLASDPTGAASQYFYAPGAAIGFCWNDPRDFTGYTPAASTTPFVSTGTQTKTFATGIVTVCTPCTMKRGVFSSSEMA